MSAKKGAYSIRKPTFFVSESSTTGWQLERQIDDLGYKFLLVATFDGGVSVAEAESIVRALNAAPELLNAVKMLADDYHLLVGTCDPRSTAGIVRAAIAQAEVK